MDGEEDTGEEQMYHEWDKRSHFDNAIHMKSRDSRRALSLPRLALPNKRLDLVDEVGGGGFWICDAVGARDWRIEYVLCILKVDSLSIGLRMLRVY